MKEINGQLYGYSYELDQTSEDDGTTCFAVDNGSVYVAYSGIWYEQPVKWAAGTGSSGGGGGGVLVVNKDKTPPFALDKTWQEIYDAASTGVVFLVSVNGGEISTDLVMSVYADDDTYSLEDSQSVYSTNSASGYPSMTGPVDG